MTRESLAFALSGTCFGLLVGWMIGAQMISPPAPPATAVAAPASSPAPAIDTTRVAELERQANADPADVAVRVQLANLYFDAERPDLAVPWYEAALALNSGDVDVSTDLAVSYYSLNQPDRALEQIDRSLALDPDHVKTLFNQGLIRAFGRQDLEGAAESWQRVVELAPTSVEGQRARQGLEGLRAAHQQAGAEATEGGAVSP